MLKMKLTFRNLVCAFGATAILAGMPVIGHAWEPNKPVEFVVMAGKGGGADKAVRYIQNIIASENMSSVPFTPVNKPGGSGAEALVHVNGKKGDNHTIMFTLNSFYTTPLRQPGLGIDIATFTPVARMAEDTFLLWVNTDRKDINNMEDFVKAAKAKGKQIGNRKAYFDKGKALELRRQGWGQIRIAKALGVGVGTVNTWVKTLPDNA